VSNADLIRDAYRAIEDGDRAALRRLYDDDVELWVPPASGVPETGVVRGADEVDRFFAEANADWRGLRFGVEDVVEHGPFVISRGTWSAEGRSSGAPVGGAHVSVYAFEAGRIVSVAHHWGTT
jgi:ketosteroid isomerase-like protein